MSTRTPAIRGPIGVGLPLAVLTMGSAVLLHLNRSAPWGWGVGALLLVTTALVVRRRPRRVPRPTAWAVCTGLLAITTLGSHPGPQHRPVADAGATRSEVVRTTHGAVSGLRTADGALEVFAGVPHARPPVGDLRWRAPVPPDPALGEFGAYHGAELMYAYGTLGASGEAEYTATDTRLSAQMTDRWVRFAATGDPNGPGLPRWPSVAESPDQVMELGERSGVRPRPRAEAVDSWLRHPGPIA